MSQKLLVDNMARNLMRQYINDNFTWLFNNGGGGGITPTIDPVTKHWMLGTTDTGVVAEGIKGADGAVGASGRGITSIVKTGTLNSIDEYTLTYSDNTTFNFSIANGMNGFNGNDGVTPHIDPITKHWMIGTTDTGVVAEGTGGSGTGVDGVTPHIDTTTKHWMIGTTDTGVVAEGTSGVDGRQWFTYAGVPTIAQVTGIKDNDFLLDTTTGNVFYCSMAYNGFAYLFNIKGQNGYNGITPHIDPTTKHWMIDDIDTGVVAEGSGGTGSGTDGITPHIDGETKHWMLGTTDTGVVAEGVEGASAYQVAVDKGFSGSAADWLLTLVGAKGDKGDKGDTGSIGASGVDGKSAYQVAVDKGYVGTEADWLLTLVGAKGDKGEKGDTGSIGPQGIQGIQGIQGLKGDTGSVGPSGSDGIGIASIARTSGNGAAGTTDTYTITFTNSNTTTFNVYNGKDGTSATSSGGAVHYGTGEPGSTPGVAGDLYFDITNGDMYAMVASTYNGSLYWEKKISLVEAADNKIYAGAGEPPSGLGVGNEYYVNISNGNLYQKMYSSYSYSWYWSVTGSLKGEAGQSAYQAYTGAGGALSQSDFNAALVNVGTIGAVLDAINGGVI